MLSPTVRFSPPRCVRAALVATFAFAFAPLRAQSQCVPAVTTKLAALSSKPGVLLIRGSTEVGTVDGRAADATTDTGSVTVDAVVLTEVGTGAQTTGLAVTLDDGRDHARSVWVDNDELGGLTHALDYLATVDSSATPLGGFEAAYRTRGALRIATYNDVERVWASLTADGPADVTVPLPRERLAALRSLVQRAKQLFRVRPPAW
jgi:hypothetical protein